MPVKFSQKTTDRLANCERRYQAAKAIVPPEKFEEFLEIIAGDHEDKVGRPPLTDAPGDLLVLLKKGVGQLEQIRDSSSGDRDEEYIEVLSVAGSMLNSLNYWTERACMITLGRHIAQMIETKEKN